MASEHDLAVALRIGADDPVERLAKEIHGADAAEHGDPLPFDIMAANRLRWPWESQPPEVKARYRARARTALLSRGRQGLGEERSSD